MDEPGWRRLRSPESDAAGVGGASIAHIDVTSSSSSREVGPSDVLKFDELHVKKGLDRHHFSETPGVAVVLLVVEGVGTMWQAPGPHPPPKFSMPAALMVGRGALDVLLAAPLNSLQTLSHSPRTLNWKSARLQVAAAS